MPQFLSNSLKSLASFINTHIPETQLRNAIFTLSLLFVQVQGQDLFSPLGIDTNLRTIPLEEIKIASFPQASIPALGFAGDWTGNVVASNPAKFVTQAEASQWLSEGASVVLVEVENEWRAYPLEILVWHEVINDELADVPIVVSFCPLCNSALAFDRRLPLSAKQVEMLGQTNPEAKLLPLNEAFLENYRKQNPVTAPFANVLELSFGVSGMLYKSNLLMMDDSSSSLWSQILGEAVVGSLSSTQLLRYPAQVISFAELQQDAPNALVLSRETGYARAYGNSFYEGYDSSEDLRFFSGEADSRLDPKARVVGLSFNDESIAYPFEVLEQNRVINDHFADQDIVIFWQTGNLSVQDDANLENARDVGAVGVFQRSLNGKLLSFSWQDGQFLDLETGSSWNLLGEAVTGPFKGEKLEPVLHDVAFWFAWAAFRPETHIYQSGVSLAENFVLVTTRGQPVALKDYRGKPTLLSFWASWCPPCQEELPMLQELSSALPELNILLVNNGETAAQAKDFLEKQNILLSSAVKVDKTQAKALEAQGYQISKLEEVLRQFEVRGMPTTILLDAEGVVQQRWVGFLSAAQLSELLLDIGLKWQR